VAAGVEEPDAALTGRDLADSLAETAKHATDLAERYGNALVAIHEALGRDELSRSGLVMAIRVQLVALGHEEADDAR
jgi:hypothetical protein